MSGNPFRCISLSCKSDRRLSPWVISTNEPPSLNAVWSYLMAAYRSNSATRVINYFPWLSFPKTLWSATDFLLLFKGFEANRIKSIKESILSECNKYLKDSFCWKSQTCHQRNQLIYHMKEIQPASLKFICLDLKAGYIPNSVTKVMNYFFALSFPKALWSDVTFFIFLQRIRSKSN